MNIPANAKIDETAVQIDLDPIALEQLAKYQTESLDSLAEGIRISFGELHRTKSRVAAVHDEARAGACSAGFRLLAAKQQVPHGEFGCWVKKAGVSWATADRYMGLSTNYSHVINLPSGTSLRKAYQAVGLIKPANISSSPLESLQRQIQIFTTNLKTSSSKVGRFHRSQVAKEIRAIGNLCHEIAYKMEDPLLVPHFRNLSSHRPTNPALEQVLSEALADLQLAGLFRP